MNQRLDNVTQNINGLFTYLKGAGVNLSDLVSSPWGVIGLQDHDDIKRLDTANVTQDAYREVQNAIEMMKMGAGFQDILRGEKKPGEQTAEEVGALRTEAGQRPGLKIQMAMHLYVSRMGEIVLADHQRFMTQEKAVMVLGDPGAAAEMIGPNSIAGRYRIIPRAVSLVGNRDARSGQLVNFMNVARGIPGMELDIRDAAEEFRDLNDIKRHPISQEEHEARRMAAVAGFSSSLEHGTDGTRNPKGVGSAAGVPAAGAAKPPVAGSK